MKQAIMSPIKVDKSSDQPLYHQIGNALREDIESGRLVPGDKLPPVAEMAELLDVTPATVRRSLEDLISDGLVRSHVGSGTFVSRPDTQPPGGRNPAQSADSVPRSPQAVRAARKLRMGISRSLSELLSLAERPGMISFVHGVPNTSVIEEGTLARLAEQALRKGETAVRGYGDPAGTYSLREAIASRYSGEEGQTVGPENVLVTNGSQQALALIAQDAQEDKVKAVCETPCYSGVPNAFGAFGFWIDALIRDSEGPNLETLERHARDSALLFYFCPWLHNPMGTNISEKRKNRLLKLAEKYPLTLIADEIYRDLDFSGTVPRGFYSMLPEGKVFSISSLSKSYMTGLRIGWLIASPEKIRSMTALKRAMDITCPPLTQEMASQLIRSGEYDRHLEAVREFYRKRRYIVLAALEKHMPDGVKWTRPGGGFQLWAELPSGYSSIALYLKTVEKGVAFMPGPMQDINHRFPGAIRICYSNVTPEEIEKGISIMGRSVRELLEGPPGEAGLGGLGNFI
jgi:2-aminoadipate transaminase